MSREVKGIADFVLPPTLFSTKWLWQAISDFAAENCWRLNTCRSFRSVSAWFAPHVFSPQVCTACLFARHYVTDIHATILKQLGLDSRRLEIPGRKRLDIDHGKAIDAIIA